MADLSDSSDEMAADIKRSKLAGERAPQPVEKNKITLSEPCKDMATQSEEQSVSEPSTTGEPAPESEEKKEVKLSQPSKEMANKVLTEVCFEERLIGVSKLSAAGDVEESLYSFEEATNFLHVDVGSLRIMGSGSVGYIEPDKLAKWIMNVFGDEELARIIEEKIKEGSCYKDRAESIKLLMEQRLKQCREVLGKEAEA